MYALAQPGKKEPFTYRGVVYVHPNLREMRFLFPNAEFLALRGNSVEETASLYGFRTKALKDHPDMAPVRWPLNERDFL